MVEPSIGLDNTFLDVSYPFPTVRGHLYNLTKIDKHMQVISSAHSIVVYHTRKKGGYGLILFISIVVVTLCVTRCASPTWITSLIWPANRPCILALLDNYWHDN